ncbi:hypothetical protein DM01DRAFT_1336918 [Hesseltinella vesiculosa]|uniref:Uncharacterized protein n=1 Tax=Hesseltinella vesiculosa TaxID=101127 RepID=A0A1X2GEG3_9FUNG|nr:hypothetical protein DM01DRAFT_1336918 [Hesseltinella vesiculosa]
MQPEPSSQKKLIKHKDFLFAGIPEPTFLMTTLFCLIVSADSTKGTGKKKERKTSKPLSFISLPDRKKVCPRPSLFLEKVNC